eukprot:1453069-Prymnesium_polylepis.1
MRSEERLRRRRRPHLAREGRAAVGVSALGAPAGDVRLLARHLLLFRLLGERTRLQRGRRPAARR